MNLKQYNVKTLKVMLDEAMEQGNIGQVDAISQEIIQREGLEVTAAMPEQFAEKIIGLAQEQESLKRAGRKWTARKPILILAASLVLLLGLGTAAYAAGFLFPAYQVSQETSRVFPFSQNTSQYKAALEYAEYIDEASIESYYDPDEHPIYMDEKKVAELCEKYGLRCATQKLPLKSMGEIREQTEKSGLEQMLSEDVFSEIESALAECNQKNAGEDPADYAADAYDYVLDDGTLRLFWNHKDKKANYSLTVVPKGAFPYMGRQYEGSAFLSQKLEGAYSYTSKQGTEFYCIPASSMASAAPTLTGYVAFAAADDKTIVIEMNGEFDDIQAEKEWKAIDQRYDEKAKKELGPAGLDQLTEKAEAWRAVAMEEDLAALNKADQLFELNGDDSGLNALREEYSRCTKAEQELYRACVKEAQAVNRFYPVEQKTFEAFLDVLGEV